MPIEIALAIVNNKLEHYLIYSLQIPMETSETRKINIWETRKRWRLRQGDKKLKKRSVKLQ